MNGIEAGAEVNQTDAEIKTQYESNPDTNAFTDAEKDKLAGIEAGADMTKAESLSERDCAAAIAFGMEVVAEGADIIALGNAGFGSASAAAAIALGLFGGTAEYWAGGEGEAAQARIKLVSEGAKLHKDLLGDPLEVLRCFGGRDIAGMVGAILAARHQAIPVILDGYVVCAAAAVLHVHCVVYPRLLRLYSARALREDMRDVEAHYLRAPGGKGGRFRGANQF